MGFNKSKAPFRTLIGVEPSLGLTFFARQGLQINVQVQTVKISDDTTWFPDIMKGHTYVPLAWIEKTSESTDSAAAEWLSILNSLSMDYNKYIRRGHCHHSHVTFFFSKAGL